MKLKEDFLYHVASLKSFLAKVKEDFDTIEINLSSKDKDDYVRANHRSIFERLDSFFDSLDKDFSLLNEEEFGFYKDYYVKEMFPFLADSIDTNSYIREKPLGYAGDYVTMNLIYDLNNSGFLGKTMYSRLINFYTCSIDVANSNIYRKNFLKDKILEFLTIKEHPVFLSVGCGPAREVIELLKENKIQKSAIFHLLDLEKNALNYIKDELSKIEFNREDIKINYYLSDLLEIIKNKRTAELFSNVDFIYVSGVFDYLSDRACKKVVQNLAQIARNEVVFFNMSLENARHRSYYEVFGEWVMYHRKKEDVLRWTDGLIGFSSSIVDFSDCRSYWILRVKRA